jgi:hypothetical protein
VGQNHLTWRYELSLVFIPTSALSAVDSLFVVGATRAISTKKSRMLSGV